MNLDQAKGFIKREWDSLIAEAVRPVAKQGDKPDEGKLIEQANKGSAARHFLESSVVLDFMAQSEAKLTHEMLSLPLEADAGRRDLAVAIQTQRQMMRYLLALTRDGKAAERELERLASGKRGFF